MNVEQQIVVVLAQQALLDPADIALDQSISALGIDSLGLVETIFALEEAFDISIPFNANDTNLDMSSVANLVAAVEALLAKKAA